MQLTQHFKLSEFTESDTALRLGIDNEPNNEVVGQLIRLAAVMEMVHTAFNYAVPGTFISVSSGYRCEKLERVITQKDYAAWCLRHNYQENDESWARYFENKAHPKGHGCDWRAPKFGAPREIVKFISAKPEIMQHIDQIIMEGTWVHIGISDNPRHMVMSASFKDGTPTYSNGVET